MEEYKHYCFEENSSQLVLEGRYWNNQGVGIAIVASITKGIDWAAYIGVQHGGTRQSQLAYAAKWGVKLSGMDARHFFPDVNLPYRQ